MVYVETRHMQAVLKAQINKTDRNDVRGIAQMMRAGLYRPVHVKTLRSQKTAEGVARESVSSCPRARMREICLSGSMSGMWKRSHGRTSEARCISSWFS